MLPVMRQIALLPTLLSLIRKVNLLLRAQMKLLILQLTRLFQSRLTAQKTSCFSTMRWMTSMISTSVTFCKQNWTSIWAQLLQALFLSALKTATYHKDLKSDKKMKAGLYFLTQTKSWWTYFKSEHQSQNGLSHFHSKRTLRLSRKFSCHTSAYKKDL